MENKNMMAWGTRVGMYFVIWFVVCFIWYYLRGVELGLHESLLKLSFFGWSGMNFSSFIFGAIQSFIWGYIAVGLWYLTPKMK